MKNKFRQLLEKFFLINDSPQKVAGGAALGIFLGIFPGEGILSALFFSAIFRLNKLSATAGVLAANMWATFIFLPPSVAIGSFLFRRDYSELMGQFNRFHQADTIKETFFLSLSIFSASALPILVGFLITAGAVSIGFYLLLLFLLKQKHIEHLKDEIHLKK
jgi:uncharacterized protein (DUF2062 family)